MVWADTPKAKYSNAKYNTILKAVGKLIEIIILSHLKTQLNIPVYLERPENPPLKYVYFEKRGRKQRWITLNVCISKLR